MLHLNGCGDVHSSCLERWTKVKKIDSPHQDSNVKPFDFSLRCLTTGPQRLHDVPGHFKDHKKTRRKKYFLITLPFPKFTVFLI